METGIISLVITGVIAAGGAVAANYGLILGRENRIWGEIGRLTKQIADVRVNYIDKFGTVNQNIATTKGEVNQNIADTRRDLSKEISAVKEELVSLINDFETGMRTSNHTLADSVSKSLQKMELALAKLTRDEK
jgi:S-adenosylmethionine hydrolase